MEEKKTNLMPIVIIELLIIAALIGLLFYTMTQKSQDKCQPAPAPQQIEEKGPEKATEEKQSEQKTKEKEEDKVDVQTSKETSIVTAFKEYYQKQKLADFSNIDTWEFTTVKEVTDKNYKGYYEFSGYYYCKDKTSDCVYLEQVGDPINGKDIYGFVLFAKVTENNGKYTFSDLAGSLN